jgi:uncharacterized phage protein (TIGR01671 family)
MSKFRVFDKQEKKLHKPDTMGELFYLFALTMDGRLGRFNEELDKYETCDPDRYVVEFSTGRKDKNGKELFHSDRVLDHFKRIMICEYNPHFLKWLWNAESTTNFLFADINQWKSEEFEIIGNIHGEADGKDK